MSVPIERITPGYHQVLIQRRSKNLQTTSENKTYLCYLNSTRVINGVVQNLHCLTKVFTKIAP